MMRIPPVWIGVTAVFTAALAWLALVHFRERPPEVRPIRFSISPPEKLTFAELDSVGPALISPDGSRLAFVGVDETGRSQLWVRPLDALAAQPLAGTAGATYPFWSPDSRYLAFFVGGKLKKVSSSGGLPEIICDAPNGRGGSWGRALDDGPGTIVFAPGTTGGLARVSAAGGLPVPVTALDSSRQETSHQQPEFLAGGRHFLYVAISNRTENDGIFIGDIRANPNPKNARWLMRGDAHVSYAPPGYLLFLRDNNLMAQAFDAQRMSLAGEAFALAGHVTHGFNSHAADFSVSTSGVLAWRSYSGAARELAWFRRTGAPIEGFEARAQYFNPSLSPDGKRIAVSRLDTLAPPTGNIWLLDAVRGSASQFTFGTGAQLLPIWSPDGRRIVYGVNRPPHYGLYSKDANPAGREELLLATAQWPAPMDWSRDGRFILFAQQDPKTKWDLWVLPLAGDRKPFPVVQTEFNEGDGTFSPDGCWIAYWSDESGRWEVYVRSFTAAGKWPVSTAGGTWPRWRRDGRELFFKAPDGKLMAVPVKAGSTFEAGNPVPLFDTHDLEPDNFTYDVSPDGQRFLISRLFQPDTARPVNICLNWLSGMKR